MNEDLPRVRIYMVRPTLDDLPEVSLPAPFSFRDYRPGDEATWADIHVLADRHNVITPTLFRDQFGDDEADLQERQIYLCDASGAAVGTVTAWHNADYPDDNYGRVHWVAIVPSHHGRGLGKHLLAACLRRIARLGYDGAYLTTNPPRVPAINLYVRFSFRPDVRSTEELEAWRLLQYRVKPEFRDAVGASCDASGFGG
jgi:GNAT superfamily N-acetyltransferase